MLPASALLAQRWEAGDDGVNHCADEGRSFFCKVGADYGRALPVVLRSFVGSVLLED